MAYKLRCAALGLAVVIWTLPAWAEAIPEPVVKMITEAAKSGSPNTLHTVAGVAKKALPDSTAEIDALVAQFEHHAESERIARLEQQHFFQGWKGEGEIGASKVTGNTDSADVAVGVHLTKDGIKWAHKVNVTADYQYAQGVQSVDKYLIGYEANYKFNASFYSFGLAQWDRDYFAGFNNRMTESFGLGYNVLHTPKITGA
jgi:putative salt-induced outer membrane protein